MVPRVTLLYASLLCLILIFLSYRVVRYRVKFKVGIGDGGHAELARAIRVQGNFVEYVPIALLMILLVELAGFSAWVIHPLGITLLGGRMWHAWGLGTSSGASLGRVAGTSSSWLVLGTASILCLLALFTKTF
ncbi:MAG TPA: MAPEG family protein [Burkholderiales bacterium]|nr:MAPEG family protein [Burkholderiales bacterium]